METKNTLKQPTAVKIKDKPLFASGHRACAGCGQAMVARAVVNALGPDTIIANATGCLEVTTTPYPESAWGVPWIHSLFENPAAIATGISSALKYKSQIANRKSEIKIVAQGGDGATFDIGFGLISGLWERGDNVLYICYDNEAYSNTGFQASGATPTSTLTTTTPVAPAKGALGAPQRKKDMIAIALAHGVKYVAQSTAGYIDDIVRKIKAAREIDGPAYIQILVSCLPGWGIKPEMTIKIARLAAQTGFYPLLEYKDGVVTGSFKVPKPTPKIEEYLKPQARYAHLFKAKEGADKIAALQAIADENIRKYNL